jgi:hypothetical protein
VTGSGNTITYTAPANAGTFTLTATSVADTSKQATSSITVSAPLQHFADLSWTDPNGASVGVTSYRVYRATGVLDANGNVTSCATLNLLTTVNAPTLVYTDSTVVSGNGYCYAVSAVNAGGEGPRSSSVVAKIPVP